MTTTVKMAHVPDTDIRFADFPGSVRVSFWPPDRIVIDSVTGPNSVPFTVAGWREFVAAVKAGELDGLLP